MYASAWRAQCYKLFMLTSWKKFGYAQKLREKMKKVVDFWLTQNFQKQVKSKNISCIKWQKYVSNH